MSEPNTDEVRAIACNYAEATNVASVGAKAYICGFNVGNAGDRVRLVVRSRGGRWIEKWEDARRLTNCRELTVMRAAHPGIFDRLTDVRLYHPERIADWIDRVNASPDPPA